MQPPGGWTDTLIAALGIEWHRIPVVIASAVIIYLVFLLLVRIFGARILTVTSGFDALVFIMLGAVAGRVILGHPPTVAAGVIGLVTLMVMEAIFGAVERTWATRRLVSARPVLVFAHGRAIETACRRTHTSEADLHTAMRRAGVAAPAEVQCIILEPHGDYSLIRAGAPLDPALFAHVVGAEEHLFTARD
ncbi:DUF421 domain-containing protein [Leucobacter triazinivorans]|uniref:DUF421 domain-containing protein n=1 Tax=Leucobacter triazinivorans TaxID=1784719 RepID=A0A4P6KDW3_9MICO|nr:YetF domain-containing protein [Leucobacter triazinivorans]QBE48432.1 DUF421 domain-containing protein [Leucobacter triazinivorans]